MPRLEFVDQGQKYIPPKIRGQGNLQDALDCRPPGVKRFTPIVECPQGLLAMLQEYLPLTGESLATG
jgi:hypothetical protein